MLFCESEISNDCLPIADKYVGQLQISMQEIAFGHLNKARNNVFHYLEDLFDWGLFFSLEKGAQVAFIAKFSDDIAMRGLSNDVVAL